MWLRIKKKYYIGIIIIGLLITLGGCYSVNSLDNIYDLPAMNGELPNSLSIDDNIKSYQVSRSWIDSQRFPSYIVSITPFGKKDFIMCDYARVFISNFAEEKVTILQQPQNINIWNPTGVYYSESTKSLFVANYNGHDVLELGIDEQNNTLYLIKEYTHPQMKSPENVSISDDGEKIAVADYDGDGVLLFDKNGKLLWRYELKQAHGVKIADDFVYATGLTDRRIVKLDYKGNMVAQTGDIGWKKNQYLWPTSIDVCDNRDLVIVLDAHSGRITLLDRELNFKAHIGSNGPGIKWFNYPYTAIFYRDKIMVADTFKARIVEMKYNGIITKQYCFSDKINSGIIANPAYGTNGKEYNFTSIPLSLKSDILNPYLDSSLQLVSGFNSIDSLTESGMLKNEFEIDVSGMPSYKGKNFWYITWCLPVNIDNNTYYVFGSPQHHTFIIYDRKNNIFSINDSHNYLFDLWLNGDSVIDTTGSVVDFEEVLKEEMVLFNKFVKLVQSGKTRLDAYREVFYPNLGNDEYLNLIKNMMVSSSGKKFYQKIICDSKISSDTAMQYFYDNKDEPYQHLLENLIIKSISDSTIKIVELTNAAKVQDKGAYPNYGMLGSMDDDPNTYTSFKEGSNPSNFIIEWEKPVRISDIFIEWLTIDDLGLEYDINLIFDNGEKKQIARVRDNKELKNNIHINENIKAAKLEFVFYKGLGQNRLLLRNFRIWGIK